MVVLLHRLRAIACMAGTDRVHALDRVLRQEPRTVRTLMAASASSATEARRIAEGLALVCDRLAFEPLAHAGRLERGCGLVARALALDERARLRLGLLCLVHDVGKLAVSAEVLASAHALSPTDLDRIQMHASLGQAIVFGIPGFDGVGDLVVQHHEYWDGTGYHGRRGLEISPEARIFALVDSYDAMVRLDRPFRDGVGDASAREEILSLSNARYDPRVVDAFASIDARLWREVMSDASELEAPGPGGAVAE